MYKSKDLTAGLKIELNNEPYLILEVNFVNIGRGQAFNKLKLKNILTNVIITKTIKISERLKEANIIYKEIKFIYYSDNIYYFYSDITNEYYEINDIIIKNHKKWIKEGIIYTGVFWNDNLTDIKLPKIIEFVVISTDDIKKDLSTHKNYKYATINIDNNIKVPLFIKEKDIIKVDTETSTYISRTNN